MDRVYQSNAIETPPSAVASSGSYPTAGNKASGQLATVPGPYWFYCITEEIRNAIVSAGLTPDPAQVDQLAKAMAKYLPLSGGTMTGAIKSSSQTTIQATTDNSSIGIYGSTASANGARLLLRGKGHSNSGWAELSAHDGTNDKVLALRPDGTLQWGGANIVRSVNGTSADANGNVTITSGYHTGNATSVGGASATKPAVVVTTWKSGTSWYRKWSDGFIEQGGTVSTTSGAWGSAVVTLPTAFKNADYSISIHGVSMNTVYSSTGCLTAKSATSFTHYFFQNNGIMASWYACGY